MPTVEECTCCQEIAEVTNQLDEQHPSFSGVCTDIWVLRAAYLAYRQQYGDSNDTQQQYVFMIIFYSCEFSDMVKKTYNR